uniref:Uncharacterized protein n=1 Tax=Strombidium inclinatum TaxID=197538 RepID=A0A7S3IKZ9_9SPIT|mmetsp:Transcript_25670/g.39484  ORF Transcript_25670/g.39484 Transcript_25670/m.39484 type:complete len:149 (+) Transcript_25670:1002-1448(+)
MFTNYLFFIMVYRVISRMAEPGAGFLNGLFHFITIGTFVPRTEEGKLSNEMHQLPHAFVMIVNLLVVMLFANSEINARVASTTPFYFLEFAHLIIESRNELFYASKDHPTSFWSRLRLKHVAVSISIFYNYAVLVVNPLIFVHEVGFI